MGGRECGRPHKCPFPSYCHPHTKRQAVSQMLPLTIARSLLSRASLYPVAVSGFPEEMAALEGSELRFGVTLFPPDSPRHRHMLVWSLRCGLASMLENETCPQS